MNLTQPEMETIHSAFFRLETRWHDPVIEPLPFHAWDALPFWEFLAGMRAATPHVTGRRFLDIGCGIGTKLSLMYHLGWQVSGIELHAKYCTAARELMPEASIVHANVMDVEEFDADLVYMYRPARSNEDEERIEQHVVGRLESGTVLFLPMRRVAPLGLRAITPEIGVVV